MLSIPKEPDLPSEVLFTDTIAVPADPAISNLLFGVVVPIPILPALVIRILSFDPFV